MPVNLPEHLFKTKPRKLSDLQLGESAHTWADNMTVTSAGECFLNPYALVNKRGFLTIQVDRRGDGFHVVIIAVGTQWERGRANMSGIPVMSVREEYDPDLSPASPD
jgi:Mlc titration factor MtfA (ptsG expression regulator)